MSKGRRKGCIVPWISQLVNQNTTRFSMWFLFLASVLRALFNAFTLLLWRQKRFRHVKIRYVYPLARKFLWKRKFLLFSLSGTLLYYSGSYTFFFDGTELLVLSRNCSFIYLLLCVLVCYFSFKCTLSMVVILVISIGRMRAKHKITPVFSLLTGRFWGFFTQ